MVYIFLGDNSVTVTCYNTDTDAPQPSTAAPTTRSPTTTTQTMLIVSSSPTTSAQPPPPPPQPPILLVTTAMSIQKETGGIKDIIIGSSIV